MKEDLTLRFQKLIQQGERTLSAVPRHDGELSYYIKEGNNPSVYAWINSCANLITYVVPKKSPIISALEALLDDKNYKGNSSIPTHIIQKMHGLIISTQDELNSGFLKPIEFVIFAEAFDEFLTHAETFHKSGKLNESAVLASIVLEDTLKTIGRKNDVNTNSSMEPLIDELVKASVFTSVTAKRVKASCAIRNHALHAEWEKLDLRDIGKLIEDLKDLIEQYL